MLGTFAIYYGAPARPAERHQRIIRQATDTAAIAISRHRKDAALRYERAFLRQVIDGTPNMVFVKDVEGRFLLGNEALARRCNVPIAELRGKTDADFDPRPEQIAQFRQTDEEVIATRRAVQIPEEAVTLADGQLRWFSTVKVPLLNTEGGCTGVLGISTDITPRKLAETALQEMNAELERRVAERTAELARSNSDLEQFAYVASHDLQEPLRAVSGFVALLERRLDGQLDAQASGYFKHVSEGAARMKTLISDLLAYSRLSHGKVFKPVDCATVFQAVLANLRAAIQASGAVVTSDALPTLTADPTQLTQLFQNLISNAIKFAGGRAPEVQVGAQREAEGWHFTVRDHGIGLAPEFAERIFVIFQRLHTREQYPGTGIGLAICKKIVERHGGKIWVESEPGQGATFHFILSPQPTEPHDF